MIISFEIILQLDVAGFCWCNLVIVIFSLDLVFFVAPLFKYFSVQRMLGKISEIYIDASKRIMKFFDAKSLNTSRFNRPDDYLKWENRAGFFVRFQGLPGKLVLLYGGWVFHACEEEILKNWIYGYVMWWDEFILGTSFYTHFTNKRMLIYEFLSEYSLSLSLSNVSWICHYISKDYIIVWSVAGDVVINSIWLWFWVQRMS